MTTPAVRERWYVAPFTDSEGAVDNGSIVVAVTVLAVIGLSAYDVIHNGRPFNAAELGMGIGSVLAGFAAYRWGDARAMRRTSVRTRVDTIDDR